MEYIGSFTIDNMCKPHDNITIIILPVQIVYTISNINVGQKTVMRYFDIPPVDLVN